MTQPVNSYTIGDTSSYSITALMQTAEIQRRGYMQYQLLNYNNTGVAGLAGYAGFNLNGSLYFITEDQEAVYRKSDGTFADISTAPVGDYYLFVVGSGSNFKIFASLISSTTITYDVALAGWVEQYTQNYLIGGFTVATVGSIYNFKWVYDYKSTNIISRIYATGYDLPIYRFTGASFVGDKLSFTVTDGIMFTARYPLTLSLDLARSGSTNGYDTCPLATVNNQVALGVVIKEIDAGRVRDYEDRYTTPTITLGTINNGNTKTWAMTNYWDTKYVSVPIMVGTYSIILKNCTATARIRNTFGTNKNGEY